MHVKGVMSRGEAIVVPIARINFTPRYSYHKLIHPSILIHVSRTHKPVALMRSMAELSEAVGSIDTNRGLLPYPSSEDAYAQYAEDKPGDTVPFYETEGRLLALWDQLNEMKLEIAVLQASTAKIPSTLLDRLLWTWLN